MIIKAYTLLLAVITLTLTRATLIYIPGIPVNQVTLIRAQVALDRW